MVRKYLFTVFCVAVLLISSGAAPVFASSAPPTIEKVFTPSSASANLFSLQHFQSALYLSVADEAGGGQIWRSWDGNTWEPATGPGFGIDSRYAYGWDMTVFNEKLYATANCYPTRGPDCPGMILRSSNGKDWEHIPLATGSSLLDKVGVFDGMIYATSAWSGGQIWRSHSGNPGTWQSVLDFGYTDGFGTGSPTEYKDQVYIPVAANGDSVYIWHSADGRHWNTTTLKITDQDPNTGLVGDPTLVTYHGDLYMAVTDSLDGGVIYRTDDGKHWNKVIQNPSLIGFRDMLEFNGDLYATVFYVVDGSNYGTQLWRSHSGNPGSWEQVNASPAGWGLFSASQRGTMAVLKGSLYFTTASVNRLNTH